MGAEGTPALCPALRAGHLPHPTGLVRRGAFRGERLTRDSHPDWIPSPYPCGDGGLLRPPAWQELVGGSEVSRLLPEGGLDLGVQLLLRPHLPCPQGGPCSCLSLTLDCCVTLGPGLPSLGLFPFSHPDWIPRAPGPSSPDTV